MAGSFASFESEAYPGHFLRHQSFRLKLDPAGPDSESLLRRDATFRIEPSPEAAETALSCQTAVQGRIPWDYSGSTAWQQGNIDRLCSAVTSIEPAVCFEHVTFGGVEWAPGQNQWARDNAVTLCAETTDASARIGCCQQEVPKSGWAPAIEACRSTALGAR